MRTPAGKECRYFYGNYYRGRNDEECRLLSSAKPVIGWKPSYCLTCPVPEILLANACLHMELIPRIERPFPFFKQQVGIDTYCQKEDKRGFDPHIGCGGCHPISDIFENPGKS